MRVLSSMSQPRFGMADCGIDAPVCGRIMMATIRALEPGGRAASVAPLQGPKCLFSREFRQGDRN